MDPSTRAAPDSIVPVIMCGGGGIRLWSLWHKALPKQFVPLVHGKSLLRWPWNARKCSMPSN